VDPAPWCLKSLDYRNAKINRKDYGLVWNAALETGGLLVGDDVTITLDVEFIKA